LGHSGQLVFDAGWDLGVHFPCHEAVGFEAAEGYGQHFLGDVADGVAQFVETEFAAVSEEDDDEDGPFIAEAVEYLADGAVDCVEWWREGCGVEFAGGEERIFFCNFFHCIVLMYSISYL